MADSPNQVDAIRQAIRDGNIVTAIKLYREATGLGLKESKDYIEAVIAGRATLTIDAPASSHAASAANEGDGRTENEIQAALFRGNKIEAIKLHRAATGKGLKEAKDFVEALEAELRRSAPEKFTGSPGGCGSAALAFVAVGGVAIGYLLIAYGA